jgi:16S rRNA (cytidine1402-2'-O)-methyltransferase
MSGTLYAVATPIGNLDDLSPRAIAVLSNVRLILCEDTRRTSTLLQRAGITGVRMAICNEHTEMSRIPDVLRVLGEGGDVALVSDAGTPAISDPGARLVRAVIDAGYAVSPIAGPSAVTTALAVSGLPADRFVFEGFLPRKGLERTERLEAIAAESRTIVLYEAPHRIARTIADLIDHCGPDRWVMIGRELTKKFEDIFRGPLRQVRLGEPRGEYVLVIEGAAPALPASDDEIRDALRLELAGGSSTRDAVATVTAAFGAPHREVYALAVALSSGADHE